MALVFALEQLEGTNIPTNSATVSNEVPHCFNYRNILTSLCTTGWMSLRIMESPEKRSRYPAIFLSPAVSVKILWYVLFTAYTDARTDFFLVKCQKMVVLELCQSQGGYRIGEPLSPEPLSQLPRAVKY
ncbi:hypothetical protein Moror_5515 [Moniliophthora roreri MCA 2997]|uniref:Uncharacterized protein n=1 Tax=Moniliophthora roreri (strain MCA 2997) TaxID=1381753 RepID=V2X358_MONRO|nr:hypothetical protein Moror_5515 [Moniliophthora roreri MCA 2997]